MNKEQRDQLAALCKEFTTEKAIECADAHYKGQAWNATMVDRFSIDNFIHVLTKIFHQLNEITISEDYSIYPVDFTPPIGVSNVITETTNLINGINEKRAFSDVITPVNWLISYLLHFNLWNKERSTINITDLEEKQTALLLLNERVKEEVQNLEQAKAEFEAEKQSIVKEKEALAQLIEVKKQELSVVEQAVPTVTNQKSEVDAVLKNVQQVESEIRATQKNQNDLYEQLKTQKEAQDKEFKSSMEKIAEEDTKLKSVISTGDEQVKYFKSLEEFIKEKQKEIIELGALAAGAALGGTFGLREKKLNDGLGFWRWAVPCITALAMVWVVIVFTCLKSNTGNIWIDVILNLAKTVPAFVLMGFVFRQYNKERNLQEEYAFKAAVANTIKAYSDLLKDEDKKENISRQTMLTEAVKQVQTPPKLYTESSSKLFGSRTKEANETLKNISETLGNLKLKQ